MRYGNKIMIKGWRDTVGMKRRNGDDTAVTNKCIHDDSTQVKTYDRDKEEKICGKCCAAETVCSWSGVERCCLACLGRRHNRRQLGDIAWRYHDEQDLGLMKVKVISRERKK